MRECNGMPVREIAKVHNPPAAQLWVRICIAIKAGRKASATNLIILRIAQRNHTAPDICLLSLFPERFYTQYEVSNATSAVLCRVSLSQVICSICFQDTKVCVPVSLLSCIPKSTPCFSLSTCLCSCAPPRTLVLLSDYLCGQGEPFVLDESYLYNPLSGERGYLRQVSVYLHLSWCSWMGEKKYLRQFKGSK